MLLLTSVAVTTYSTAVPGGTGSSQQDAGSSHRHLLLQQQQPASAPDALLLEWLDRTNMRSLTQQGSGFPLGRTHTAANITGVYTCVCVALQPTTQPMSTHVYAHWAHAGGVGHTQSHLSLTHQTAATDFIQLLQDPEVSQIQLVGDLIFSPDYFPPEHSNDITKGINVSHTVRQPLVSHPCCASACGVRQLCFIHLYITHILSVPWI